MILKLVNYFLEILQILTTELKNKEVFKAHKLHVTEWNYSLLLHNSSNLRKTIVDIYHKK